MSRVMVVCAVWQGLAAMTFAGPAESSDWPQWQGPDRNAISKETGLLQQWPVDSCSVLLRLPPLRRNPTEGDSVGKVLGATFGFLKASSGHFVSQSLLAVLAR